jgi:predicted Zn-dependent peptidase
MPEYHLTTLANGLRVVTVEMPHLHCAEMVCYIGTGGRHEEAGVAGISHFLEHMLFRGTAEHPSSLLLERAFEAIGGAVNAATDSETTCFHSRLHPEQVAPGMALFASMLQRPLLHEVEIERRIILEEALEDLNAKGEEINPDNLTARLLWPGSPLALPTIGTAASLQAIDEAALRRHHGDYYVPGNCVLTLAGPVRHPEVVAAARTYFGDWQGGSPPPTLPCPELPRVATPEALWVKDADSQINLQLAFRIPGRTSPHAIPLRILRRVLSWGGTSRLMLRLREELGLTYSVEANLALYGDCGCFTVDLAVTPANLGPAVREVLAILQQLADEPVGEEELARVVRNYLYDLDFSRDHTEEMAVRFGWGALSGYLRTLEEDRAGAAALRPADLQATATALFTPGALKAAFVGPWSGRDQRQVEKLLQAYRR